MPPWHGAVAQRRDTVMTYHLAIFAVDGRLADLFPWFVA
jgi:hypothetical protein